MLLVRRLILNYFLNCLLTGNWDTIYLWIRIIFLRIHSRLLNCSYKILVFLLLTFTFKLLFIIFLLAFPTLIDIFSLLLLIKFTGHLLEFILFTYLIIINGLFLFLKRYIFYSNNVFYNINKYSLIFYYSKLTKRIKILII